MTELFGKRNWNFSAFALVLTTDPIDVQV